MMSNKPSTRESPKSEMGENVPFETNQEEIEDNVNKKVVHERCLRQWLKRNKSCPLCKRDIV